VGEKTMVLGLWRKYRFPREKVNIMKKAGPFAYERVTNMHNEHTIPH
jgi:hypothetical protein